MLVHWIWFAHRPSVSDRMKQELLAHFQEPEDIYYADNDAFDHIPGMTPGRFQGGSAPENAGQIICTPESPGNGQHHIADFPAQRCSPISRFPADGAFQNHIIDGFPILA